MRCKVVIGLEEVYFGGGQDGFFFFFYKVVVMGYGEMVEWFIQEFKFVIEYKDNVCNKKKENCQVFFFGIKMILVNIQQF